MELLLAETRTILPSLYSQESADDPVAYVKWFTPDAGWTWYVMEWDGDDICFGFVVGHESELSYFSLSEIETLSGPLGLRVERDLYFEPMPLSEIRARHP